MPRKKEFELKVRVDREMKERVAAAALDRGETESLIIREALTTYFSGGSAADAVARLRGGPTLGKKRRD